MRNFISICVLVIGSSGMLAAHTNYIGFSGAPTSSGTCTRSCHAQNSFTPTCDIAGFPQVYVPGQQYTISVRHVGGLSIRQFNCSIRAVADSSAAGTIEAANATAVYNVPNETNGVRWSSASTDSGTFLWTAPAPGAGRVTLYWAGLQGSRSFGADQQIVLVADEQLTGIDDMPDLPNQFSVYQNYPNPFNASTKITFQVPIPGTAVLEICNVLGNRVRSFLFPDAPPGHHTLSWDGTDELGNPLPSGLYFYQLRTIQGILTRKMVLLR